GDGDGQNQKDEPGGGPQLANDRLHKQPAVEAGARERQHDAQEEPWPRTEGERQPPEGREGGLLREPPAVERGHQPEVRVGEVHDPAALVDEHDPEREQRVDQAGAHTDRDVADERAHRPAEVRRRLPAVTLPPSPAPAVVSKPAPAPARNTDRSRSGRSPRPADGPS